MKRKQPPSHEVPLINNTMSFKQIAQLTITLLIILSANLTEIRKVAVVSENDEVCRPAAEPMFFPDV